MAIATAGWKVVFKFAYPGYGWQETFYLSAATDSRNALATATKLVPARTGLCNPNVTLDGVFVSQEPDYAAGTLANPGNPLQVRGDSLVSTPLRANQAAGLSVATPVTGTDDADPWISIQFTVVGAENNNVNGPFHRRNTHLRGLSENYWSVTNAGILSFSPGVQQAVAAYIAQLASLNFCVRAAQQAPFAFITSTQVGALPNTVVLETAGLPAGLSPGAKIAVHGWPRGQPGYNGVHAVVGLSADNSPIIASIGNLIPAPVGFGKVALYQLGYMPIQVPDLTPTLRLRKRDTGRDLWVSRAKKRARKPVNP